MLYKIHWIEEGQTSTGKVKATATLIDDKGVEHSGVTIWGDFANFKELRPEGTVEGEIVPKGNWKTLYAPKPQTTGFANKRGATIEKAVERKEKSIEKFQTSKEEGIQQAAIMRDATILTAQELAHMTTMGREWETDQAQEIFKYWRKWLEEQWSLPF